MKLPCIGEAMTELKRTLDRDWSFGFAGDTFNTAVYASRLLARSGSVGFMSRVGEDPLSSDFAISPKDRLASQAVRLRV